MPASNWEVPERYNIAADVIDKHDPAGLAMLWEDWQGNERRLTFEDMQALTNRTANALRAAGVGEGDRVGGHASADTGGGDDVPDRLQDRGDQPVLPAQEVILPINSDVPTPPKRWIQAKKQHAQQGDGKADPHRAHQTWSRDSGGESAEAAGCEPGDCRR